MHDVLVALDRDGNLTYYIDGVAAGTLDISADAAKSMDIAAALYALGTSAVRTAGTVQSVEWFNRALTAAEVLDLYRNGVAEADKWGSQTNLLTGTDSTFAGAGNWVIGGTIPGSDINNTVPGKAYLIGNGGFDSLYITKLTKGKKYRAILKARLNAGASTYAYIGSEDTNGMGYATGNSVRFTPTDTEATYSGEFTASTTEIYLGSYNINGIAFEFDDVELYEIGATLALTPEGIQTDKWYDSSTNALSATYPTVGWTLTQQPSKKRIKQPTPTAETTAVTLTIAKLLTGIITATHTAGATQAYTLPTGALTDAWPAFGIDDYFDWVLINLSAAAADTVTVTAAATGHTIVGNPIVQSAHSSTGGVMGNSAGFRTRKTAAATFVTYRIN